MSVSTDLQQAVGIKRNLFVKIEGINAIFWMYHHLGEISSSRPVYSCLSNLNSGEIGIDFESCTTQLSAISLDLIDFLDSSNQYYFAKLFAPLTYLSGTHSTLANGDDARETLAANATSIVLADGSSFTASGTCYLGRETFIHCGKSSNTLTTCVRGLYPCVTGSVGGITQKLSRIDDSEQIQSVSTTSFSILGRKVALYITTWDETTGAWNSEANSHLFWTGRISDRVNYRDGVWTISCTSILDDLAGTTIGTGLGESSLDKICISADIGRTFKMSFHYEGKLNGYKTIDALPTGAYYGDLEQLVGCVNHEIRNSEWTLVSGYVNPYGGSTSNYNFFGTQKFHIDSDGYVNLECTIKKNYRYGSITISTFDDPVPTTCQVLQAFGWGQWDKQCSLTYQEGESDKIISSTTKGTVKAFRSYISLSNPAALPVDDNDEFFDSQGDVSVGYLKLNCFHRNFDDLNKGEANNGNNVYLSYSNKSTYEDIYGVEGESLTGIKYYYDQGAPEVDIDLANWNQFFCGSQDEKEPIQIKQCYIPSTKNYVANTSFRRIGPFEQLLYPLLSTGTTDYNHASYDKLPIELSCGVVDEIVDIDSFLEADDAISNSPLANRIFYEIQSDTFMNILKREMQLFGYCLTWNNQKLSLKKINSPEIEKYSVTISNDNLIQSPHVPISYSVDGIINSFKVSTNYNLNDEKYHHQIIINDANSVACFGKLGQVEISHPAIFKTKKIKEAFYNSFLNRFYSQPFPLISVTVAPTLIDQIHSGDVVWLDSSYIPNIFGDGNMSCQVYAFIQSIQWNLSNWLGELKLILLPYSIYMAPLCPSALVSSWDAVNYQFTLADHEFSEAGDPDDGSRFSEDDVIYVIARAPEDPESLSATEVYGPLTVAKDYESDGAGLLTVDTCTLTGWDTNIEYIISYADYSSCATQQLSNVFLGNNTTQLVDTGVYARRWQ